MTAGEDVKILLSGDGKRRVRIVRRSDGNYSVLPERFYENVIEGEVHWRGWITIPAMTSLYQSAEIAEREARANYSWLTT